MMTKKLVDAINEQINKELYSEYLYLSMRAWFMSQNLDGFANWLLIQTKEEHAHGLGFIQFIVNKGEKVVLKAIAQPDVDFKTPLNAFEIALKHEQFVTKSINDLMDLAAKEKDHSAMSFIKWYVDEQVEEETNFEKVIAKLKLIKDRPEGLILIDNELATRVYAPVNINGIIFA